MLLWLMRTLLGVVLAGFLWMASSALTGHAIAVTPAIVGIAVTLAALAASFSQNPTIRTTGTIVGGVISATALAFIAYFGAFAMLFKGAGIVPLHQVADNTAPLAGTKQHQIQLPPAKTGTDDDSVRPLGPSLRPQTIAPLPKPQLPSKARIGTDDDSVRPMPPLAAPPR